MTGVHHDLITLVYSSTASEPFDDDRLGSLLAQSRRSNAAKHITGMLLYRGGRFIQVLEGADRDVRALVSTIGSDRRHTGMRVLLREPIAERRFTDWTMGYQPMSEPREPVPAGYRSTFDDLEHGDGADSALRALGELTLWFRVRSSQAGARVG